MSKHILVCDDDPGISGMIKDVLEREGYHVTLVPSGKDIKKIIANNPPDLILLDLWMPEAGGQEAIKALKAGPNTSHIPVIIVSAVDQLSKIVKKSRADGFIAKPFDLEDLLKIVKKFIREKTNK